MGLAEWMRAATVKEREKLALKAGTTVGYLYQIAGGHAKNISLRKAVAIVSFTVHLHMKAPKRLPEVTFEDLL